MADVAVVRKRVKSAIEQARRDQAERRGRVAEAQKSYDTFLETAAIPVFRMIANVLKSEGLHLRSDDAGRRRAAAVRAQPRRRHRDGARYDRGSAAAARHDHPRARQPRVQTDRSIKGSNPLVQLTEDDVIEMLLEELRPWLV